MPEKKLYIKTSDEAEFVSNLVQNSYEEEEEEEEVKEINDLPNDPHKQAEGAEEINDLPNNPHEQAMETSALLRSIGSKYAVEQEIKKIPISSLPEEDITVISSEECGIQNLKVYLEYLSKEPNEALKEEATKKIKKIIAEFLPSIAIYGNARDIKDENIVMELKKEDDLTLPAGMKLVDVETDTFMEEKGYSLKDLPDLKEIDISLPNRGTIYSVFGYGNNFPFFNFIVDTILVKQSLSKEKKLLGCTHFLRPAGIVIPISEFAKVIKDMKDENISNNGIYEKASKDMFKATIENVLNTKLEGKNTNLNVIASAFISVLHMARLGVFKAHPEVINGYEKDILTKSEEVLKKLGDNKKSLELQDALKSGKKVLEELADNKKSSELENTSESEKDEMTTLPEITSQSDKPKQETTLQGDNDKPTFSKRTNQISNYKTLFSFF